MYSENCRPTIENVFRKLYYRKCIQKTVLCKMCSENCTMQNVFRKLYYRKCIQKTVLCKMCSENHITENVFRKPYLRKCIQKTILQLGSSKNVFRKLYYQPIWVVEQGNYHVIVVTERSGVQYPSINAVYSVYVYLENIRVSSIMKLIIKRLVLQKMYSENSTTE